LDAYFNMLKR